MPLPLPREHSDPAWRYSNFESVPSRIARPTCFPCCAATCAVGGNPDSAASPTAYTPSAPFTFRSSSTMSPRMSVCPSDLASFFTSGRAPIPAAHTSAPTSSLSAAAAAAALCSAVALRGVLGASVTSLASTCVTAAPVRTSTPLKIRCSLATFARDSSNGARMRGMASTSTIRMRSEMSLPYRLATSLWAKSASSAESSTPVGPPPTTTTFSSLSISAQYFSPW
mmetsp:Transcript_43399/g.92254  ORF Transcript_43399/g.92254 Transcript_43399/m.92254 type:complete len:225 (+) Transcript_43399:457-1131(+)